MGVADAWALWGLNGCLGERKTAADAVEFRVKRKTAGESGLEKQERPDVYGTARRREIARAATRKDFVMLIVDSCRNCHRVRRRTELDLGRSESASMAAMGPPHFARGRTRDP